LPDLIFWNCCSFMRAPVDCCSGEGALAGAVGEASNGGRKRAVP
jgi:hypothetical protein